ncbi:MAG: DUF4116 domain-containing protein [bacterium]
MVQFRTDSCPNQLRMTTLGNPSITSESFGARFSDPSLGEDAVVINEPSSQAEFPFSRSVRSVALAAVRRDGMELGNIDPGLRADPEIALAALRQTVDACPFLDESLWQNREFVLEAVRIRGYWLRHADERFKNDREIVLAAVSSFSGLLEMAHNNLRTDRGFQEECFEASFYSINYMIDPSDELVARYQEVCSDLRELDLDPARFRQRFRYFSLSQIQEIIDNRRTIRPDNRPVAVVVTARSDWNNAFQNSETIELLQRGYRVVPYEARQDTDLYQAIREVGESQPISLLVIEGHGNPSSTEFDDNDIDAEETDMLDLSDEQEMRGLDRFMAEDSIIVVSSCSTAQGGREGDNVANMLGRVFPTSTIYAPRNDFSSLRFEFDGEDRVVGAQLSDQGEDFTYILRPR